MQRSWRLPSTPKSSEDAHCVAVVHRTSTLPPSAELTFSYVYTALSNYFNRDTVALLGFARFFHDSGHEERYHAQLLMDQQARRGGRVHLHTILAPSVMDFSHAEKGAGLWSMELALAMEKLNFIKLRQLHAVASQHNDPQMTQFIGRW